MANVSFVRPEVANMADIYQMIEDCISGEKAVKYRKTLYLPQPNKQDESYANIQRYNDYLKRAVFYNVTRRTLNGLVGMVLKKEPTIIIPPILDIMMEDVTGTGLSFSQFVKVCVKNTIAYGRCGILVDYPPVEHITTLKQLEDGNIRPIFRFYESKNIINWRKISIGAKQVYSLIVLKEKYIVFDDGFEVREDYRYRVLSLEDGIYYTTIYEPNKGLQTPADRYPMVGADGSYMDKISFVFIGSEDNDCNPDNPPIYDLATLNIAHYRNSADYEESSYICGQPTPYFYGLSQDWVDNVLKGSVQLGSRGAVPLPINSGAGLLQAEANSMPFEAMQHKEKQMVALGAKLIESRSIQRTATEASIESSNDDSILSGIASNVSDGITHALSFAESFISVDQSEIIFKLTGDFNFSNMTDAQRQSIVKEWQAGAITFNEMRAGLKSVGIAYEDVDSIPTGDADGNNNINNL